jgi:hypothetical protein
MKIKAYLEEGTGYNVDKEKIRTLQVMNDAITKIKDLDKLIKSTSSVDPLFYISLTGEIKRLHLSLDHIVDLVGEYKDATGERV